MGEPEVVISLEGSPGVSNKIQNWLQIHQIITSSLEELNREASAIADCLKESIEILGETPSEATREKITAIDAFLRQRTGSSPFLIIEGPL
jgi:hypothetical protein